MSKPSISSIGSVTIMWQTTEADSHCSFPSTVQLYIQELLCKLQHLTLVIKPSRSTPVTTVSRGSRVYDVDSLLRDTNLFSRSRSKTCLPRAFLEFRTALLTSPVAGGMGSREKYRRKAWQSVQTVSINPCCAKQAYIEVIK